jgi:hypothetical protein
MPEATGTRISVASHRGACDPHICASRTITGLHNWSRGYKTYRHGQVTGFVSALERLAVREISAVPVAGRADRDRYTPAHGGPMMAEWVISRELGGMRSTPSGSCR